MGNISSWLKDLSADVPGAPKTTLESALRSVIRSFCETTQLYIRALSPISIVANTATYTLTPPSNTSIVMVEHAMCQDQPIYPESADMLDRGTENWRDQEASGQHQYMADSEKVLRLRYIPTENVANGLEVWVSLKPSATTDTVPDFIVEDYYEAILDAAKAKLFKMTNKPWTNVEASEFFRTEYHEKRSVAKRRKITGLTKYVTKIMDPPFFVV
jgi:hypothetical protein